MLVGWVERQRTENGARQKTDDRQIKTYDAQPPSETQRIFSSIAFGLLGFAMPISKNRGLTISRFG